MHEHTGLTGADSISDGFGAECRRHAQIASSHRLAEAEDVRCDPGVVRGKQRAAAAEPGRDLVEDEQDVVRIGELPCFGDVLRRVEPHTTSTLDDRLENDGRYLVVVVVEQSRKLVDVRCIEWVAGGWNWTLGVIQGDS